MISRAIWSALGFACAVALLGACSTKEPPLPALFKPQIAAINARHGTPPVLLPDELSTGSVKLYPTGGPNRDGYDLEVAGAPRCGGADACFIADFVAINGEKLTGRHFALANGDPAVYRDISCGASCAPASIEFVHDGVLYGFQVKTGSTSKKAMTALAREAIAAGPR